VSGSPVDDGAVLPTMRQLVDGATAVLAEAGVASPRHDAMALAAHCLGLPRLELVLAPPVTPQLVAEMTEVVERRRRREPLQQILGYTVFRYVTLRMAPGVFVPRPETEVVAGVAIDEVQRLERERPGGQVLAVDLCTGSGAIACALDTETQARVVAVEQSPDGVALARANLGAVGKAGSTVLAGDVRDDDLLADLDGQVDVVVANPPYIPPDAIPNDPEVRDHDPDLALYGGGADGLGVPAAVVRAAARLLRPGGLLVMEHADVQGPGARAIAEAVGAFEQIATGADLTGRDRYLSARRSTTGDPDAGTATRSGAT
jgi:release factor glutamine methyltransferase